MNSVDELNLLLGIGPARPQLPVALRNSGYLPVRALGKGSYGQALLVFHEPRQRYFAVKHLNLAGMSSRQRDDAHNEINILQKLHHPNIVHYVECYKEHPHLYIVMEYADGGDVYSLLSSARAARRAGARASHSPSDGGSSGAATSGLLTEAQVVSLFVQATMAVRYMHDRRLLHRDIKSSNIFLTKNHIVKLGDFGISTVLQSTMAMASTMCGTPCYFSPELCQGRPYNNKSDMWALGVLLYELCAGHVPFESTTMKTLMRDIVHRQPTRIPAIYSDGLWDLVVQLLQKDPRRRPDAGQVLMSAALMKYVPELIEQLALDPAYAEAAARGGGNEGRGSSTSNNNSSSSSSGVEHYVLQRGAGASLTAAAVAARTEASPPAPLPPPRHQVEYDAVLHSLAPVHGVIPSPAAPKPAPKEARPPPPRPAAAAVAAPGLAPVSLSATPIASLLARFDAQKQQLADRKQNKHDQVSVISPQPRQNSTAGAAAHTPVRAERGSDSGVARLTPGAVAALRQQELDVERDSQVLCGGSKAAAVSNNNEKGVMPAAAPRRSFAPPPLPAALRDSTAFPVSPAQGRCPSLHQNNHIDSAAAGALPTPAPTNSAELGAVLAELSTWRERSLRRQRHHDDNAGGGDGGGAARAGNAPTSPLSPAQQPALTPAVEPKAAKQRAAVAPTPAKKIGTAAVAAVASPVHSSVTPPSPGKGASVGPAPLPPSAPPPEAAHHPPNAAPAHAPSPRAPHHSASTASSPTSPFAHSPHHDEDVDAQSFVDAMGTALDVQALQETTTSAIPPLPPSQRRDPRQSMRKSFHDTRRRIESLRATLSGGSVVHVLPSAAEPSVLTAAADGAATSQRSLTALGAAAVGGEDEGVTDLCFSTACLCGRATTTCGYLSMIYGSFICSCEVCARWTGAAEGVEWLHLPLVEDGLAALLEKVKTSKISGEAPRHSPSHSSRGSAGGGASAANAFRAEAAQASSHSPTSRGTAAVDGVAEVGPTSELPPKAGIRSYTHCQSPSTNATGVDARGGTQRETYVIYSCATCGGMLGMVHDGVQGLLLAKATLDAQSLQILSSCAQIVVEDEEGE